MNLRHVTVIVALAWFSGTVILPAEEPAREFPEKIIFQHSFPDGSGKDAASGILIRTVPAGIPANAVRSGTARKMLRIDSSKAFREGAQKVSLVFTGLPLLEYPAPRYEFSARFQGEKGRKASLFLESYDQDNKHLWFRKDIDLTGEPQTAGLTVSFPPGARKVYLQIDIPYAGEFFLSRAAFLQKSSSRGPRELLFHHTFDNGAGADYAKGDAGRYGRNAWNSRTDCSARPCGSTTGTEARWNSRWQTTCVRSAAPSHSGSSRNGTVRSISPARRTSGGNWS